MNFVNLVTQEQTGIDLYAIDSKRGGTPKFSDYLETWGPTLGRAEELLQQIVEDMRQPAEAGIDSELQQQITQAQDGARELSESIAKGYADKELSSDELGLLATAEAQLTDVQNLLKTLRALAQSQGKAGKGNSGDVKRQIAAAPMLMTAIAATFQKRAESKRHDRDEETKAAQDQAATRAPRIRFRDMPTMDLLFNAAMMRAAAEAFPEARFMSLADLIGYSIQDALPELMEQECFAAHHSHLERIHRAVRANTNQNRQIRVPETEAEFLQSEEGKAALGALKEALIAHYKTEPNNQRKEEEIEESFDELFQHIDAALNVIAMREKTGVAQGARAFIPASH